MVKSGKNKINSVLVAYLPELRGFFYSSFWEFCFNQIFIFIKRKVIKQIAHLKTDFGVSGLIILPYTLRELKNMSRYNLEEEISKAVSSAVAQGARRISFAGQLPSLLNYCANFSNERLNLHKEKITTGHTMTCLAMASTFESVLKETKCKTLSVIGVGSIGRSSLILILEKGMKRLPKKIILCDLKKRKEKTIAFAGEIEKKYQIQTLCVFYCEDSFNQVYQSDMFLGASSSGNVLKVDNLRPGSILIDDSFPPVISVRDSIKRIKNKQDVLILGGGKMLLPQVHFQSTVWYIPQALISLFLNQMGKEGLPGCWLEAVVFSAVNQKNLVTQGHITSKKLLSAWELKSNFNLKIPPLHFYKYIIPQTVINKVQQLRSDTLL